MSWIEASCPECGTVDCRAADFDLAVCGDTRASFYAFACPKCGDRVQKHADDRVVEVLIAEGVNPTFWELPAEMTEEHSGPPLTTDDLLDFLILLNSPGWFAELTRASG